jgi:hypothetical protein
MTRKMKWTIAVLTLPLWFPIVYFVLGTLCLILYGLYADLWGMYTDTGIYAPIGGAQQ